MIDMKRRLNSSRGAIPRLAGNSFPIKRLSMLLVPAFTRLVMRESVDRAVLLVGVPVAWSWSMDGYFN